MKTNRLIDYILDHPEYTFFIFDGLDDEDDTDENFTLDDIYLSRVEAIDILSGFASDLPWRINGSLQKGTLIIYKVV